MLIVVAVDTSNTHGKENRAKHTANACSHKYKKFP